jgi:hypothetical protein
VREVVGLETALYLLAADFDQSVVSSARRVPVKALADFSNEELAIMVVTPAKGVGPFRPAFQGHGFRKRVISPDWPRSPYSKAIA